MIGVAYIRGLVRKFEEIAGVRRLRDTSAHQVLQREAGLRTAVAAERSRDRGVGEHDAGLEVGVRNVVVAD